MKFDWKVEEMKLMNEKGFLFVGSERIYDCENKLSTEEKIEFVDRLQDGKLSYIINLKKKFMEDLEKGKIKIDDYGRVKTVSRNAWIKRNDTRNLHAFSNYGKFFLLGCEIFIESLKLNEDFINSIFHRQLKKCERLEREYFLEHDEYSVLTKEIREYIRKYSTTFGVPVMHSSLEIDIYDETKEDYFESYRKATLEELKTLKSKYTKLEEIIENLSKEVNIKY